MKNLLTIALVGCVATMASASLFSDNFDVDSTANWQFNSTDAGDLPLDLLNNELNVFFDYSTLGIPSAPNSTGGSTRGIKMQANVLGSVQVPLRGMSCSPIGQSFTGDYELTFDCWQNFNGPAPGGGSGSTQLTMAGIGAPTTPVTHIGGPFVGLGFGATGDGGSSADWRIYNAPGAVIPGSSGWYAAGTGSINNTNPYYLTNFPSTAIPASQTALFAGQVGSTNAGCPGFAWHTWTIRKVGGVVTWKLDSIPLATAPYGTPTGDNIFLAYSDINATASLDPFSSDLLCGIIDNVKVEALLSSTGNLAVSGYAGDLTTETFTAYFKDNLGAMIGSPITFTTDASGNYSIVTPQTGTFSVIIRGDSTLNRKITGITPGGSIPNTVLLNGNVVVDTVVDLTDYTVVVTYFNAVSTDLTWDVVGADGHKPKEADVTGDGAVDLSDYTEVVVNFNGVDED